VICGASIATRGGTHFPCGLPEGHSGECAPRRPSAHPAGQKTSELLRQAAAMLATVAPPLSAELEVRALLLDKFELKAERDRRRGFFLPLAWINELQGSPESMAQPWNDNDGAVLR
jgi:hypothetical protein